MHQKKSLILDLIFLTVGAMIVWECRITPKFVGDLPALKSICFFGLTKSIAVLLESKSHPVGSG